MPTQEQLLAVQFGRILVRWAALTVARRLCPSEEELSLWSDASEIERELLCEYIGQETYRVCHANDSDGAPALDFVLSIDLLNPPPLGALIVFISDGTQSRVLLARDIQIALRPAVEEGTSRWVFRGCLYPGHEPQTLDALQDAMNNPMLSSLLLGWARFVQAAPLGDGSHARLTWELAPNGQESAAVEVEMVVRNTSARLEVPFRAPIVPIEWVSAYHHIAESVPAVRNFFRSTRFAGMGDLLLNVMIAYTVVQGQGICLTDSVVQVTVTRFHRSRILMTYVAYQHATALRHAPSMLYYARPSGYNDQSTRRSELRIRKSWWREREVIVVDVVAAEKTDETISHSLLENPKGVMEARLEKIRFDDPKQTAGRLFLSLGLPSKSRERRPDCVELVVDVKFVREVVATR